MSFFRSHRPLIIGTILGALIVYLFVEITIDHKLSLVTDSLDETIESSLAEATELTQLISQGGLTKGAQSIVEDCTEEERERFDTKLSQLDSGLSTQELIEVDVLFSRCASTQSIQRTLMVLDFGRQVQNVSELVSQRNQIDAVPEYDEKVRILNQLVIYEEDVAALSLDLVYLQREIIDVLMSGESVSSERANELRKKGSELRNTIQEKATLAGELRAELLAL